MLEHNPSYRYPAMAFQLLNFDYFGTTCSPYVFANDDTGGIDFAVTSLDRLANSRDAFFQSSADLEFALSDSPESVVPAEAQILGEMEDLIAILHSVQGSSAKGSPEHLLDSTYRMDQTPQTAR